MTTTMMHTSRPHTETPEAEQTWGAGAIIVRRPEVDDSALKDLNVLQSLDEATIMIDAFRHLDEQTH